MVASDERPSYVLHHVISPISVLRQMTQDLGMQLHAVEETFVDMARTLMALGIARPVKACVCQGNGSIAA